MPVIDTDTKPSRAAAFDQWVATHGQVSASVPMWLSRRKWISTVSAWAATEEGRTALKRHHVSLTMFVAVIRAVARHADGRTGRNVAVTNETIAAAAGKNLGKDKAVSVRTVKTIRQCILAPAGWAMEVTRGHGQGGGWYNRPSLWHLLSRRAAVCTLSSSSTVEIKSPVSTNSPSAARTRRRNCEQKTPRKAARSRQDSPRASHTLTLASHLAGRCLGFGKTHPGRFADVLEASHLELSTWSPRQLLDALDAATAKSRQGWPDHLASPAGFLAHRLAALPARPQIHAATPIPPRFTRETPTSTASPQTRAAGFALVRASVINARRAAA